MQKRSRMPRDTNQLAAMITSMAIGDAPAETQLPDGRNPAAVALGKLGGLKGGKARAKAMTKKERSEAAQKAAKARWRGDPYCRLLQAWKCSREDPFGYAGQSREDLFAF